MMFSAPLQSPVAVVFTRRPGDTYVRGDERDRVGANLPTSAAWLGWLPVASLLLAADGRATAVNPAWVALSSMAAEDSLGHGWLNAVVAPEREAFGARMRLAVAQGKPGRGGCHLATAAEGQWSSWWWQPPPAGGLVCIAVAEDGRDHAAPGTGTATDLASAVVHRLFRVGLTLQSAAGLCQGPAAVRLQNAVDELDGLIRDIRDAAFGTHAAPQDGGDPGRGRR
jgi:hypothetical protein